MLQATIYFFSYDGVANKHLAEKENRQIACFEADNLTIRNDEVCSSFQNITHSVHEGKQHM